jgi:tetratricopeptide (TPR) repeat protein
MICSLACLIVSSNLLCKVAFAGVNRTDQTSQSSQQEKKQTADSSAALIEAEVLSAQVVALYQQGKFDEALPLAKRALKIRETLLARDDLAVAHALDNLARIYIEKKKPEDAEPLLKRSLAIFEKNPGKEEQMLGRTLDLLAQIRFRQWDFIKAEELLRRAVKVKEQAQGTGDTQLLYSLDALADFYKRRREYQKAEPVLRRVVAIKEKVLGESHLEVGKAIQWLACLTYRNKELNEAERLEARANHILYSEAAKNSEPLLLPEEIVECRISAGAGYGITFADLEVGGVTIPTIAFETDEAGKVISAKMINGSGNMKSRAEKAALSTRLRPTIVDGRPVPVKGIMSFFFGSIRP